jgi:uncharacterized protein (TIGR00297 family)
MTPADSAGLALAVTALLAVAARLTGALTTGGAVAGAVVGACVSVGFGLPGLAVLGTFFVVGTLATRIGWKTKQARGTAEAGEGRRDAKRVLGKGGVAAVVAIAYAFRVPALGASPALPFVGSVAAALADTLGTEIGTIAPGQPRSLPFFRSVASGTPGAVSVVGTLAAAAGAVLVAVVGHAAGVLDPNLKANNIEIAAFAGLLASLLESLAVGLGLRAPGFARNVLTTGAGAFLSRTYVVL